MDLPLQTAHPFLECPNDFPECPNDARAGRVHSQVVRDQMVTGGLPGERDAGAGVTEERMSRCQQLVCRTPKAQAVPLPAA
ncbi:MAG: hypothetical protein DMF96_22495 [Acidobacteria bacterium]|nr:MAG: hypothetical protein DMF96_22495 [Acidobacteriota bacterium]